MIFFIISNAIIVIYYIVKDIISKWKAIHRNACPFCGVYLHGYQYKYRGAKFDDNFCSHCGKALNSTKNDSDYLKEKK